ncbi:MAG: type II secretion system protein GspL [Desulfococcaceae bacterium]|jgi:general secretion pathway protein L|nr:type II secretion system protein GspL [Desulfococcaceae bacterium]
MSRKILGLDIRQDSVSAVLIDSSLRENRIEDTVSLPMAKDGSPEERLKHALTALAGRMPLSASQCVSAFPPELVSYRNIRIPFKGDKKIGQVLPFELEPLLPFPADELITDFYTIRPAPDQPDQTDILAMTVRKEDLQHYLNILSSFGLDPKSVSPGGYPTAACLNSAEEMPEEWMLLDMQEKQADFFLISGGKIHLMRSFPLVAPAEEPDMYSKNLYAMMQQTLQASEELFSRPFAADLLLLSGKIAAAADTDIAKKLEEMLEIRVKYSDMLKTFEKRVRISPDISWQKGQMDNALALAISEAEGKNGINFRKGPFATRKDWAAHKKNLISTALFLTVILLLLLCNTLIDFHNRQKQIDKLEQQIRAVFTSAFPDVQRIVNPLHQMQVAMDELRKNAPVPGEGVSTLRIMDLLNDISQRIPAEIDVEFKRMVLDPENILISGDTDTFNSVDSIQTALEGSPLFKKVTISSTSRDKKENRINFKIKVDL